ncbi:small subunit ribosomal protein S20 [Thermosulfidibacter takaii ABI70S6]|uniref:Small ribosomal subunit protein bS20 n=1 Tax=Thermosulfidibacter takaii (strain DSM 17441 / JCM 13301 / NBRC 103674 / ABI70S6) TaxID=1298851 RepID=A0A0S3QUJ0_THET7|nr:30S ribosomal protein S20 [Thermosulfidibacter takaii]BAT71985.1 small subunit ribosomal protein S20 [Thermosulfidibacter takaii ABI70S6]
MPNIKSAKKRLRQAEKRRLRNKAIRSYVKTCIKKVLAAIEAGEDKESLMEKVRIAQKAIDKACSKGTFHKNEAARKKSRLMAKVNKYLASKEA